MRTYAYGYPRLGENREFKRAIESYWQGKLSREDMQSALSELEQARLATYRASVDAYPVGEMTLYDPMLDTALMVGLYPIDPTDVDAYFELARGANALPMRKWFNTNYHYLVSEIPANANFSLRWRKPLEAFRTHSQGYPYLIGAYTFLRLSRGVDTENLPHLLKRLVPLYAELLSELQSAGAEYVHVDEPAFAMDVPEGHVQAIQSAYRILGEKARLLVFTYYDSVDFLPALYETPIVGIGLDLIRGKANLNHLRAHGFPSDKILIAGVVDGQNVWKTDLLRTAQEIRQLQAQTNAEIWIANSAPLFHLPVSVAPEEKLDPALKERIAFAKERLHELRLLKAILTDETVPSAHSWNTYQHSTDHWYSQAVQERVANLTEADFQRDLPYSERVKLHRERLTLPLLPTTTIGSFPQTPEVRQMRQAYRTGKLSAEEYDQFIREQIRKVIAFQEEIGLDVLVHGEFERSDMVEFFAEKMEGIAFTQHGWLLSYGTRVYRPPIIYGDVWRPEPMTVKEITYAQSLTQKPVKGMLTGPVTIIAWSFIREDIPIEQVAYQIALAVQDEVRDLENAGIRVIQIDEAAFRELAPLKRAGWDDYFRWATRAFRLASRAKPETQLHTHMCYSEFTTVLPYIDQMDADVITIEATRSKGEVLSAFEHYRYERQIGPGVYDIHSPAIPSVESIQQIIERAVRVFPVEQFWVNPDCGLKTRKWEEVELALRNMVQATRIMRRKQVEIY